MTGVYIYYKIAPAALADGAVVVSKIFADVVVQSGVQGRLLVRADDRLTWMEIYEPVPDLDAFDQSLATALAKHDFQRLLPAGGRRVIERFVPIAQDSRID